MGLNLALIGKNISHSQSEKIYRKILNQDLDSYTLLDYGTQKDIPDLNELFRKYDGISVTAPYKNIVEWANPPVDVDKKVSHLDFYNLIYRRDNHFFVCNTDYLALKILLSKYIGQDFKFVILGSGAMSTVAQKIFDEKGVPFTVLARSKSNLDKLSALGEQGTQHFIINCCSREFVINKLSGQGIFYDLNYAHDQQRDVISQSEFQYVDGFDLLYKQAELAIPFWSTK